MKKLMFALLPAIVLAAVSCRKGGPESGPTTGPDGLFSLSDVAKMLSELPIDREHLSEVHDAVSSSSGNGYDEEYTMNDLFSSPGAGVGDAQSPTRASSYSRPLKELFADYLSSRYATRAGASDVQEYLDALSESDMQIYWPYSDGWDGETFPIVTFDPGYGAESNYGYEIRYDSSGLRVVDSVLVTESVAMSRPVWVINRNSDSAFTPLDLFVEESAASCADIRTDESAVTPAGVLPEESTVTLADVSPEDTDDTDGKGKMLLLRSFKALRNYDSWFAGASEFFIKCGAVDGFRAATDDELRLYTPSVTDFMLVVKRSQIGYAMPLNVMLLTDFTSQMEKIAFAIMEDDGGKTTSWKCEAVVKYKSKSFGFTLDIPYKDKDDIVWRGQLSADYLSSSRFVSGRFGDVEVTFELR